MLSTEYELLLDCTTAPPTCSGPFARLAVRIACSTAIDEVRGGVPRISSKLSEVTDARTSSVATEGDGS